MVPLAPLALALAASAGAGGCLIPPPVGEAAADAGANHIPVIVESNPRMPGPVVALDPETRMSATFTIDVEDRDTDDDLHVKLCRDFAGSPWDCPIELGPFPGGAPIRTIELKPSSWCDGADRGPNMAFDVVVADRPFDQESAWPTPGAGGASSWKSWVAYCTDQQ